MKRNGKRNRTRNRTSRKNKKSRVTFVEAVQLTLSLKNNRANYLEVTLFLHFDISTTLVDTKNTI